MKIDELIMKTLLGFVFILIALILGMLVIAAIYHIGFWILLAIPILLVSYVAGTFVIDGKHGMHKLKKDVSKINTIYRGYIPDSSSKLSDTPPKNPNRRRG